MGRIDQLIRCYESFVSLPWARTLSGQEKVWFLIYDKTDERRIRARIEEFELITQKAKHKWFKCDLTDSFAEWMATQDYMEGYFESPDDLDILIPQYQGYILDKVRSAISTPEVNGDSVVALIGVASLFGFLRVSDVIHTIAPEIRGRLLVLFPGEFEANNYRLLDARDGWNYMSVPITAECGEPK